MFFVYSFLANFFVFLYFVQAALSTKMLSVSDLERLYLSHDLR